MSHDATPVKYETSVGYLAPEGVSASGLAALLATPLSLAARGSSAQVRARVGVVGWAVLWPAWRVATGPTFLYYVLWLTLQIAVAVFMPALSPLVRPLLDLLRRLLARSTPPTPDRPSRVAGRRTGPAADAEADLIDRLIYEVWKLRGDPRTLPTLDAIERFLFPAPDDVADAVRAGLAGCEPYRGTDP